MRLNKECIRDLLLFVEYLDAPGASEKQILDFGDKNNYSKEELIYTIQKLEEANYINANVTYLSNKVSWFNIDSITYDGHQFIDTIRDESVWAHVKKEASKLKDVPITVLSQLALEYMRGAFNL